MSKKRPCPNSRYEIEKFESIPFDLIIEILTRLPAKSVARFCCVSKLWDSTIPSLNFTESFYTISSSRPKLLVVCVKDGETFFFSSPQPPLAANYHMSFPVNCPSGICRPVRGLVCCINQHTLNGRTITVPLICNPSTGQYLTLPRVKTRRKTVINYLGYDPIGKQFKVLCMTNKYHSPASSSEEHQVLTLGTGKKLSWRMINCDIPHSPNIWGQGGVSDGKYDGICINGVCYYLARIHDGDKFPDIVCFDIRYEKFNCIKKAQGMMTLNFGGYLEPTLINHKGKLAMLNIVSGMYTDFQLWVVEDAEKHEWSNYIYVLPPLWRLVIEEMKLRFVGTTSTSEIVLSPDCIKNSFYLLYYNLEMNTITVVDNIQGMEAFESCKAYTFLDHVENVKPMTCV